MHSLPLHSFPPDWIASRDLVAGKIAPHFSFIASAIARDGLSQNPSLASVSAAAAEVQPGGRRVVSAVDATDLDAAPCWRNRWFMRDGRTYWGDLVYPSRCSAERTAFDQIERWKLRRWMVADGVRVHIRDFSMCLQLPVGSVA